jgi:release factor glutamine methyltransferase
MPQTLERILFRRLFLPFYRLWALRYIQRTRAFKYNGIVWKIPSGVFHPGIYFSTPVFLDFLQKTDFTGKKVLDMGTGSGALAIAAALQGATVTAVDIHPDAVATARQNAQQTALKYPELNMPVFSRSDLFREIPGQLFDYILVNPPYYPKNPQNNAEYAFFAGASLEYFERFFQQAVAYTHPESRIWMVLSEDCQLDQIQHFAALHHFTMEQLHQRKKWGEKIMIMSFQAFEKA